MISNQQHQTPLRYIIKPVEDHQASMLDVITEYETVTPSLQPSTRCESSQHASYKMSRGFESVVDIWQEYTTGLAGYPSIVDMERTHGTSWHQAPTEARFFSRRRVYSEHIKRLAIRDKIIEGRLHIVLKTNVLPWVPLSISSLITFGSLHS